MANFQQPQSSGGAETRFSQVVFDSLHRVPGCRYDLFREDFSYFDNLFAQLLTRNTELVITGLRIEIKL